MRNTKAKLFVASSSENAASQVYWVALATSSDQFVFKATPTSQEASTLIIQQDEEGELTEFRIVGESEATEIGYGFHEASEGELRQVGGPRFLREVKARLDEHAKTLVEQGYDPA